MLTCSYAPTCTYFCLYMCPCKAEQFRRIDQLLCLALQNVCAHAQSVMLGVNTIDLDLQL